MLVLFGLFAKIIFRLNTALTAIESTSAAITQGDLTRRVEVKGDDEFGHIADYVNKLVSNFQSLVKSTQESTAMLANSALESAAVTDQTQKNVLDQQAQTQMIAAAIHEFTATVHEVANNTASAATASQEADSAASEGQKIVLRSIEMIEHLSRDLSDTVNSMHTLQKHAEAIGSVVDTIQGISEQTNLLALNAAIEAARAGDQGRALPWSPMKCDRWRSAPNPQPLKFSRPFSSFKRAAEMRCPEWKTAAAKPRKRPKWHRKPAMH